MIWRRTLLLLLLALTGLALQTTLLGPITLAGTKPELLLLVTIALAMADGPAFGAVAGFWLGLAADLFVGLPHGVGALTFTIVGFAVGAARQQFQTPSAWLPMGMVSVATFGGVLFYGGMSFMLGQESLSGLRILRHAGFAAVYGALLTPFVFPVVRGLAARLGPPSGAMR